MAHKRYRIANKTRFTAFVAIMIILAACIIGTVLGFNTISGASTREFVQVRVQSGDTLWGLAKEYGPADADVRLIVYEICKLNGVSADSLQTGQFITIPREL
ncbi:MAG: LysM peptidoglycan-binding domain-containing protein [Clostridia bacterium]|nr:LysM peptidoglycan-binding domain-containing protein [Clostridia bacterium]